MAEFKRLPKEKTTEPSVELSLKRGGSLAKDVRNEKDEIKRVKGALKRHEAEKASKAHRGLKTGGVALGNAGGYKTGGVANAQGGYKKGGLASSGIIKSEKGKSTMSDGAKSPKIGGTTGTVKRGNAGGYKDGGFAEMQKSSAKHSNGHSCMKKGGKC